MSRYTQRKDGEGWTVKNGEIFKLACCDCGLIHEMVVMAIGLKKGATIGIAAKRNNRATAQRRKKPRTNP